MIPWKESSQNVRIAVIGDLILDEYLEGEVLRISPEAPVPVHLVKKTHYSAGGAANAARNVSLAGGTASLFSVCGNDHNAETLRGILVQEGINIAGILTADDRPTTKKTRISAGHQQMIRVDWERTHPITADQQNAILQRISAQTFDGCLISDYGKGALTKEFVQNIIKICRERGVPCVVDPKGNDYERYRGSDLITPNLKEAIVALGLEEGSQLSGEELGERLRNTFGISNVLVTMGAKGMVLIRMGEKALYKLPQAREVFDVSGAGDTVASIMALSLAAKANVSDAIHLANLAAGIVVEKWGTQPVTLKEIEQALKGETKRSDFATDSKIQSKTSLAGILAQNRKKGRKVVFTNGCFDLLHAGHLSYLQKARALGDCLIIGVNTDASIRRLKGPSRPLVPLDQRMELLSGLTCVDFLVAFDEDTPEALIQFLGPDILVKGADYQVHQIAGAEFVQNSGGDVRTLPLKPGISSSEIIRRIREMT